MRARSVTSSIDSALGELTARKPMIEAELARLLDPELAAKVAASAD